MTHYKNSSTLANSSRLRVLPYYAHEIQTKNDNCMNPKNLNQCDIDMSPWEATIRNRNNATPNFEGDKNQELDTLFQIVQKANQ